MCNKRTFITAWLRYLSFSKAVWQHNIHSSVLLSERLILITDPSVSFMGMCGYLGWNVNIDSWCLLNTGNIFLKLGFCWQLIIFQRTEHLAENVIWAKGTKYSWGSIKIFHYILNADCCPKDWDKGYSHHSYFYPNFNHVNE